MQRLSGVLLILAGAALGGYTLLPATQNGAEKLAEITRISAAPDRGASGSTATTVTETQIAKTVTSNIGSANAATLTKPNGNGPRVFSTTSPLAPTPASASPAATPSTWTAVVTTEPAEQTKKLTSSKPGDDMTRAVLASDLQRELQRVGCYGGEINGKWTPATQRAMATFMERVNATLPTGEPDYILLTLVQGHSAVACGIDCPAGQVGAEGGRCVPQAVVAQATRKSQKADDRRVAEERKAQQQERLAQEQRTAEAQRIAQAKKVQIDQAQVAEAKRADADARRIADAAKAEATKAATQKLAEARRAAARVKPQDIAAVEPEKLPWQENSPVQVAPAPARAEPLPGMMALSGPRTEKPELPPAASVVTPVPGPTPQIATLPANAEPADAAPEIAPPVPRKAQRRAVRQAALPQRGLPGGKSGVTARKSKSVASAPRQIVRYRAAKVVRRPSPVIAYSAPRPKLGRWRTTLVQSLMLRSIGAVQ